MADATSPAVRVVIPNLNGAALLPGCLRALRECALRLEVVIVDNGSSDASLAVAGAEWPDFITVANTVNTGYAKACNQGAAGATAPLLLFLNNDAMVSAGCIESLVSCAAPDRAGGAVAWQPPILSADGISWDSAGSLFTRSGFLDHSPGGRTVSDSPQSDRRIFSAKGACMLVDRVAFEAVGGFEESFFAYFEETDLCWRFALAGRTTEFVDVPPVFHIGAVTAGRLFSDEELDFMFFRNRLTSLTTLCGRQRLVTLLPLHVGAISALAALALLLGRRGRARGIARAMLWIAAHPRLILNRRRQQQASRVWTDEQVLDAVTAAPGLRPLIAGGLHYLGNRPKAG